MAELPKDGNPERWFGHCFLGIFRTIHPLQAVKIEGLEIFHPSINRRRSHHE
jgi:hypothetical protein